MRKNDSLLSILLSEYIMTGKNKFTSSRVYVDLSIFQSANVSVRRNINKGSCYSR